MKMPFYLFLTAIALCVLTINPAQSADAPLGGIKLLPGYTHKPLQGIDSIVGEIVNAAGAKISYEIGHVSKPGQPRLGGGFRDRPKLTPKDKLQWYREQQVNGQSVHVAYLVDKTLLVSYPEKGMNFRTTIRSSEQFADAMLMILTYPQPAAPAKKGSNPSEVPTTVTVDGKVLVLNVEGINNAMPTIGPSAGSRVYFILRVATKDRSPVPKGLTIDTVSITRGDKAWETDRFDPLRFNIPSRVETVARNAPAWTAGAGVEVVVKFRDAAKKEHQVRTSGVRTMTVH